MAPSHQGKAINSAGFIMMIAMVLPVILHLGFQILQDRTIQLSDSFIAIAMVFGVGFAIAISRAVAYGLGDHITALSVGQIASIYKALYASEFLYVVAMASARFATLLWVRQLSRDRPARFASSLLATLNLLWLVIAVFAVAFQCADSSEPYYAVFAEQCIDWVALWSFLEGSAMFITLATIGIIFQVLWRLQMGMIKKLYICSIFSARALELPVDILRLVYLSQIHNHMTDTDPTYDSFALIVTTAVFLNFAIILTALPFLVKYIKQLSAGYTLEESIHTPGNFADGSRQSVGAISSRSRQNLRRGQDDLHEISAAQPFELRTDATFGERSQPLKEQVTNISEKSSSQ